MLIVCVIVVSIGMVETRMAEAGPNNQSGVPGRPGYQKPLNNVFGRAAKSKSSTCVWAYALID